MGKRETDVAISAVKEWIAAGKPRKDWFNSNMNEAIRCVGLALSAMRPAAPYWRGTNRPEEYADVLRGAEIISRNHSDGSSEKGMSVSQSLATVWAYGYKYAYRVTGDVIGNGSDGEPVLCYAKVASELMDARDAIAMDQEPGFIRSVAAEIGAATGLSVDQVLWLSSH